MLSAVEAPPDFHARFSARRRLIGICCGTRRSPARSSGPTSGTCRNRSTSTRMTLGSGRAAVRHARLRGFQSAGSRRSSTRRTLTRSEIVRYAGRRRSTALDGANDGDLLAYEVRGDGFLRHMVRAIVGTLVDVGRGWREPDSIGALMQGAHARTGGSHGAGARAVSGRCGL